MHSINPLPACASAPANPGAAAGPKAAAQLRLGALPFPAPNSAPASTGAAERSQAALALPALVFCRSRKRVEGVARELAATLGWDRVGAYHAGLTKEERRAIEEWFFHADDAVLVATCAYGMGVDKSNIRTTIHYDLPGSVEAFLQESGRAGRDGGPAESIVLFGHEDKEQAEAIADPVRRQRYGQLLAYCQSLECRRVFLMELLGSECEVCFGCDNCRGAEALRATAQGGRVAAVPAATGVQLTRTRESMRAATEAAWRFLRRNQRMLTSEQVARIVRGHPEPSDRWAVRRLPRRETLGQFRDWSHAEVIELLDGMRAEGRLRRVSKGPWRGRWVACRLTE